MILLFILSYIHVTSGQASQWIDATQKTICHQRWLQMDWLSILRPCRYKMDFGKKINDKEKTSTKWSHTLGVHFEKTGEMSKIAIQSRKPDGRNKKVGGDTWRVFVRGADRIAPLIADLNNGVYEADFIVIQPGFYKVEIVLESTLCQAYEDPPSDWLKRGAANTIDDEKAKFEWEPLRGGNISFKIDNGSENKTKELKKDFHKYKESCGPQYNCDLLWKGVGRWANKSWIPFIDEISRPYNDGNCIRKNEGVLKITGDDLTRKFSRSNYTNPLCKGVFKECRWEMNGEQPNGELYHTTNGTSEGLKTFSTKTLLENLKKLLKKSYMGKSSGLLLNYGHPFVQNIGFKRYRSFMDRVARIIKEKYKGRAVWQTMATRWMESNAPEDHFKNHQRIKLFNAYATSAMCAVGVAVLDVFQMTESAPPDSNQEVLKTIGNILTDYFRAHPTNKCPKKEKKQTAVVKRSGEVNIEPVVKRSGELNVDMASDAVEKTPIGEKVIVNKLNLLGLIDQF